MDRGAWLKSLLQHCSSKASILLHSAFFMVQLLILYMTTGSTIALIIQSFVSKVMPLLFKYFVTLCRFDIAFLSRSKRLLISWLQWPSAVILETKGKKNLSLLPFFPLLLNICHEVIAPDAMILVFWVLNFKLTFSTLFFHPHQEILLLLFTFCL